MSDGAPLRIGTVDVFPASNEIDAGAGRERLPPRIMALLLRLAAEPGQPVDRATLLDDVWERRGVTDEVLSRAIADLRTALGDDAKAPRFIETLPKVGYRLVAAVASVPAHAEPASAATPVPSAVAAASSLAAADGRRARSATVSRRTWYAASLVALLAALAIVAARHGNDEGPDLRRQLARATVLAGNAEAEVAPRFSPDGRLVAYAAGGERSRIVVETLATRTRHVVGPTDGIANSPVFTPDGRRVVFLYFRDDACTVMEAPVDGTLARVVAPCPAGLRTRVDLSPDGRTLVGSAPRRHDLPYALVTVDVGTGTVGALTAPEPGDGDDVQPRYSPDGRQVAFFRGSESRRELWLVDVAAPHAARRVSPRSGLTYGAAFMPAAQAVLVATDWSGFRALERVDLATGASTVVGGRGARFPDVSRTGDIVFEAANYRANLWRIDVTGQQAPTITWPSNRYSSQAVLSPDGRRVAFVSNRDGTEALYVGTLDGDAVRVPGGEGYRTIRPRWADDGRALYAVRSPIGDARDRSRAVKVDIATGGIVELDALGDHVEDVTPAGDGRKLIVGEYAGHAVRLSRTSLDGRDATRLALPLISEFRVADGRIAFAQPQLTGLTVCELATLACRPLPVPIDDATRYDWTLAPDALWRQVVTADGGALERIDLATGAVVQRYPTGAAALGVNVAAGPGGVPLFVAREDTPDIDLMVAPR
ncbi:MAG: PD40 domain-containing protein [Proteobacteria bacterium]|nr:PD40 domain-containing protein [Pseudomonadota bacterium]